MHFRFYCGFYRDGQDEGLFLFDGNLVWIKPKLSQSALNCKMKRQLALPQLTDRKRMRQTLFVFTKTFLSPLFLRFYCVLCHWFVKDGRWSLVFKNGSPVSTSHRDLKSLRLKHHLSLTELISSFSGHKYILPIIVYHPTLRRGAHILNLMLKQLKQFTGIKFRVEAKGHHVFYYYYDTQIILTSVVWERSPQQTLFISMCLAQSTGW